MNRSLVIAGRIIFGIPFFVFGVNHFLMANAMAGLVPGWIPGGVFWVYLTGAAFIVAAACLVSGRLVMPAGIGLAAMLALFVLTIHLPSIADAETMRTAMTNGLKDTALAGGALAIAGTSTRSIK